MKIRLKELIIQEKRDKVEAKVENIEVEVERKEIIGNPEVEAEAEIEIVVVGVGVEVEVRVEEVVVKAVVENTVTEVIERKVAELVVVVEADVGPVLIRIRDQRNNIVI